MIGLNSSIKLPHGVVPKELAPVNGIIISAGLIWMERLKFLHSWKFRWSLRMASTSAAANQAIIINEMFKEELLRPSAVNKKRTRLAGIALIMTVSVLGLRYLEAEYAAFLHLVAWAANFGMMTWVIFPKFSLCLDSFSKGNDVIALSYPIDVIKLVPLQLVLCSELLLHQ